jgi:ABC-type glycerol-3-phosphate transport system permease component
LTGRALRRFWRIVVPLLACLGHWLFSAFSSSGHYLCLVIIRRNVHINIGIANMELRQGMIVWGSQMAASVLATIPVILLVLIMQRQFLRGLTAGAFKA